MNRNYYCKVNSQEEANKLLKLLSNIDESILTTTTYIENSWNIIGFHESKWCLLDSSYLKKDFIKVPTSELIDYVTGKKLDKDALLEDAKKRYPVGTKFRCPAGIGVTGIHKIEIEDEIEFYGIYSNNIDILGKGYVYYNNQWAEIVEEPKVETKFEVGKWYYNSEKTYAKCNRVINDSSFDMEEWIVGGKYIKDSRIWNYHSNMREASLEEIQQYLPEGHPDKFTTPIAKEEFVLPEKWCVKITEENKDIVHRWKLDCTHYYNYTLPNKYVTCIGTWMNSLNSYIEITFDQFKKYVLKENINEVKEEDKPMEKWSVGSYIVALDSKLSSHCTAKVTKGTIYQLTSNEKDFNDDEGGRICFLNDENNLKWFPTLQEAQKFSDELLGKSKTGLSVEDLVEGEIYSGKITISNGDVIFKPNECELYNNSPCVPPNSFHKANNPNNVTSIKPATPKEKKWLKTCIKQDKFIEQSELDKYDDEGNLIEGKEYPEYVETVDWNGECCKNGGIYKVLNGKVQTPHTILNIYYSDHKECFKPSTKSAYDVQKENNDWIKEASIRYSLNSWVEDLYGNVVIITNNWYILENKLFNNSNLISIKIE